MKSLDIENLALRKRIVVQMYFQQYFFIQYLLDLKEAAVIRNFSSSFHNLIFFSLPREEPLVEFASPDVSKAAS